MTITPNVDQFGTQVFSFEVTDSNGLSDTHNITFTVNNINDAPVICNVERSDCMPIFSEDDGNYNILPEGFGTHTKFLGDVERHPFLHPRWLTSKPQPAKSTPGPPALLTWARRTLVPPSMLTSSTTNWPSRRTPTTSWVASVRSTLGLADDGAENQDAATFDVVFSVAPVNDAPVIKDWNRTTDTVMV